MLVNMIGMRSMVVGYNHQFGRNREGSFEKLMELSKVYDFEVEEIPPQDIDEVAISSTKIRKALLEGDVVKANMFLGYDYLINGKVVPGSQQGRSIDYPTANVAVSSTDKLIPADGVYAARVTVNDQTLMGMVNIGMRPTVQGKDRTVEVHIIDFDSNIYDLNITLHLVERIRDEKKFDDLEALRKQLDIDRNKITQILEKSAR
ncbi:MAG: riboflavin biosynthesis protein RibF, partial [Flavobacteriales bacterium]|nr:riboflavin biosynthesis protein RibF [Flavobacteriales bacterium]